MREVWNKYNNRKVLTPYWNFIPAKYYVIFKKDE